VDGRAVLNEIRDESPNQQAYVFVANGISSRSKLTKSSQSRQVSEQMLAVGTGVLNEVSPLSFHAAVKFTLLALVPSFAPAGNDVRDEQYWNAEVKSEQLLMSISPNELSDVQEFQEYEQFVAVGSGVLKEVSPLDCHAAAKFTLLALVPSFAPAGNDVRAEVPFHADEKFEPLLASMAPNELSEVELCHALVKLTVLESLIDLNSTMSVRSSHAYEKEIPLMSPSEAPRSIKSFLADSISAPVADSGKSIIP